MQTKGEASASVERIVFLGFAISRRGLQRPLVFTLGFGDGVGSNKQFAFSSRHPEEIGEKVETRRDRHGFELGGHVSDIARDVETLPRHNPLRRIIGSLQRPRVSALGRSPRFSAFPSRETYFFGHTMKQSIRKSQIDPLKSRLSHQDDPLIDVGVTSIRAYPAFASA
jgi:hypothetical protein